MLLNLFCLFPSIAPIFGIPFFKQTQTNLLHIRQDTNNDIFFLENIVSIGDRNPTVHPVSIAYTYDLPVPQQNLRTPRIIRPFVASKS